MERMDFVLFNCDFMTYSNMTNVGVAVYAPIIYGYEDKYFSACVDFLKTGKETNIEFGRYSTDVIQKTMKVSYIQSLVILHNIEQMPKEASNIYNPDIVE